MKAIETLALVAVLLVPRVALGEPAVAMTDLDDAYACLPLGEGRLAVATGGGLVGVDREGGAHVLTALDGLPGTRAYTLAGDGDRDGVWVGTEGGAALVSMRSLLAPASPALSPAITRTLALADTAVRAVWPAPGGVYFGTWGRGLLYRATGEEAASAVPGAATGTRVAALADQLGALYVAYADGPLAVLDHGVLREAAPGPTGRHEHGQALASVALGGGSVLLLGDLEGLFSVAGGAASAPVDARALAWSASSGSRDSSDARLLVGTFGAGLLSGPAPGALHEEPGVPRFVRGVAARGATRCAATPEGVFVSERDGERDGRWRKVPLGGPPSNDITALAALSATDGRVAVGTFDHGAAIHEHGAFRTVAGLAPGETVEAVAWQGEGARARLLLGTARGLVRVEADGTTTRFGTGDGLPSARVRSLLVLPDDRVLVGTDGGAAFVVSERAGGRVRDRLTPIADTPILDTHKPHKGTGPRPLESPMHATWALAAGDDGTLWIGTTVGLYHGKDGQFRRASVASGELVDDWVTAIAVQGHDVFVGTYSGGVTRLRDEGIAVGSRGGRAQPGDELAPTQLGGGYINPGGLALVGGELLAATMEGLFARSATDDGDAWRPRTGASPGRDVTAVRLVGDPAGGMLWVASRRGIGVSRP